MDEKELTTYVKLLKELDVWKAAYEILFATNEKHTKRLEYLEMCLSPEPPCRLENDNPADNYCDED
jgi:hypothetical protein